VLFLGYNVSIVTKTGMMMIQRIAIAIISILSLNNWAWVEPLSFDSQANMCVRAAHIYEKEHGLPQGLLQSVTLVETGTYNKNTKSKSPWPWTVNVKGKGYHFKTKEAAVTFAEEQVSKGLKSIDVGCGQVNMKFHGNNFNDIQHAMSPKANLEYAAKMIADNFKRTQNWHTAVAWYHSKTEKYNKRYLKKILSEWQVVKQQDPDMNLFKKTTMVGNGLMAKFGT
jgi:hypothetical protein